MSKFPFLCWWSGRSHVRGQMLEENVYIFILYKHKGYHNTPLKQFELEENAPYLCKCYVQTHQGMWMSYYTK